MTSVDRTPWIRMEKLCNVGSLHITISHKQQADARTRISFYARSEETVPTPQEILSGYFSSCLLRYAIHLQDPKLALVHEAIVPSIAS